MALINCPECGKQNISDTALACPQCGFAVREHTESDQKEKAKKLQTEALKQQAAIEYVKLEISKYNKILWIAALLGIGSFILALFNNGVNAVVIPCFIVFWSMVIILLVSTITRQKRLNDLMLIGSDFAEFEHKMQKRNKAYAKYQATVHSVINAVPHRCPECGSTDTKRISADNRAFSVAVYGLASSKIGKQYQCNNCGHKW